MCFTGSCPYEYPTVDGDCECRKPSAAPCPVEYDNDWDDWDYVDPRDDYPYEDNR